MSAQMPQPPQVSSLATPNIDDELFGDAASDYMRAAELYDRKTVAEDRLMTLWNEEEELRSALSAGEEGE